MINDFKRVLKRTDTSDDDAAAFITQGLERIQSDPDQRYWFMEKQLDLTAETTPGFNLSTDLLQVIDVLVQDDAGRLKAMKKVPYRRLLMIDPTDLPWAYSRFQSTLSVAGTVPAGRTVRLLYYGKFTPWASYSSENELSLNAPRLGVYAALTFAGTAYRMDQAAEWEAKYQQIKAEVVGQNIALESEGGPSTMEPIYHDDEWQYNR